MVHEIVIERSYGAPSSEAPRIGALLMVRNEAALIGRTLESVAGHVDCLIVLDSGSTDDTMGIVDRFSATKQLDLYLIRTEFVDFATSRNVLLDYADTRPVDYLLLLDANDELQGGEHLRAFAQQIANAAASAFYVTQTWWTGKLERYVNFRFLRARCGWRYAGAVHEWLRPPAGYAATAAMPDRVTLHQDRTHERARSVERFARDKALLLSELDQHPGDPRTLFYLAQTCASLGEYEDAYYYNSLRVAEAGFEEERFHAMFRNGIIARELKRPWPEQLGWFMAAFAHSERAEPLICITEHYIVERQWHAAYMYGHHACRLHTPRNCLLFVNAEDYSYQRWHLMGAICHHTGHHAEGREAAERALAQGKNPQLDEANLRLYRNQAQNAAGSRGALTMPESLHAAIPAVPSFAPDGSPWSQD